MIIQITDLREVLENKAAKIREAIVKNDGFLDYEQAAELGEFLGNLRLLDEPQRSHMVI